MAVARLCNRICIALLLASFATSGVFGARLKRFPRFPHPFGSHKSASGLSKSINSSRSLWSEFYFTQNIDHFSFSPGSYRTFQQKYILWDKDWSGADAHGPIFVYVGNEGPVEWFANNAWFIREIAPSFGALVIAPEHRYYGESMPFGSVEAAYATPDTRAFLTAEQALADAALLLTSLQSNLSASHCPLVVFGGSYGGMLAAWFRLKYPHIAVGALASSAPLLQFGSVVPPDTFYSIASSDFRRESESCFQTIRASWAAIHLVGSTQEGLRHLSADFHMCRQLSDSWELSDWLESAYSYLAMVDYPLPASFLQPLPAFPVRQLCAAVDSLPPGAPLLSRIFLGASLYYNYSGGVECFDPQSDPHGMSGWGWQYCTQMVMPFASDPSTSMFPPFPWDLEGVMRGCREEYGVEGRPEWVLTHFGGKDMKATLAKFGSNIVFSNGALDPWSGGSVLEDLNPTVIASVIPDGAHHLDLRASTPNDPPSVQAQRELEKAHITRWIKEYYKEHGIDEADVGWMRKKSKETM